MWYEEKEKKEEKKELKKSLVSGTSG